MQKQRWIDASLRASSVHSDRPDAVVGSDLRGNVSEPSVAKTQQLFLSWNWADDKNWNTVRRMNLLICIHGCRILSIWTCRFFFDCSSKRFCTFVLVYISFLKSFSSSMCRCLWCDRRYWPFSVFISPSRTRTPLTAPRSELRPPRWRRAATTTTKTRRRLLDRRWRWRQLQVNLIFICWIFSCG